MGLPCGTYSTSTSTSTCKAIRRSPFLSTCRRRTLRSRSLRYVPPIYFLRNPLFFCDGMGFPFASHFFSHMADSEAVHALQWMPDSSYQLVVGNLYLAKLKRFDLKERWQHTSYNGSVIGSSKCTAGLAFSPYYCNVFACRSSHLESPGCVELWDVSNNTPLAQVSLPSRPVASLLWSPSCPSLLALRGPHDTAVRVLSATVPHPSKDSASLLKEQGYESDCDSNEFNRASSPTSSSRRSKQKRTSGRLKDSNSAKLHQVKELDTGEAVAGFGWLPDPETGPFDGEQGKTTPRKPLYGFVVARPSGILRSFRVHQAPSISWSPSCSLAIAAGAEVHEMGFVLHTPSSQSKKLLDKCNDSALRRDLNRYFADASSRMHLRTEKGFGLDHGANFRVAEYFHDADLMVVWYWMAAMKRLQENAAEHQAALPSEYVGLVALLEESTALQPSWVARPPQPRKARPAAVPEAKPEPPPLATSPLPHHTFHSPQRALVMALCGWHSPAEPKSLQVPIAYPDTKDTLNSFARRVSVHLFMQQVPEAIRLLSEVSVSSLRLHDTPVSDETCNFQLLALALSSFTSGSPPNLAPWRATVSRMSNMSFLPAYLSRAAEFLAMDTDLGYNSILKDADLSVLDRIAFACGYLDDTALLAYVHHLKTEAISAGTLSGIVLTGLTPEGVDLMQEYIDATADVQVGGVLFAHTVPAQFSDERAARWLQAYRQLLNTWRAFHSRCHLDIALLPLQRSPAPSATKNPGSMSAKAAPQVPARTGMFTRFRTSTLSIPPPEPSPEKKAFEAQRRTSVAVRCNYCSVSLLTEPPAPVRSFGGPTGTAPRHRPTTCPSCRKPLPRCAVCLMQFGAPPQLSGVEAFNGWTTWCVKCHHGGHSQHLQEWFSANDECPVHQCNCQCTSGKHTPT
eukprot:NODE_52_length_2915_cov_11.316469_g48_i0.p1 GENE.NODE_52_length_2915_cov_11.316469_g48_i0~~NODE_52_length_2915_cov_11.316469_g48_i0.p1  ORF type:complete len:909 (+),score=220.94 NODE_52_length_2915_cov_11.316469_g48_i0:168-2894(+)